MSLKQSSPGSATPRVSVEHSAVCWQRERNRQCLCIEADAGGTFFFPYQHFVGAHHHIGKDVETLRIMFSSHEVTLSGQRLGEIAMALQDLCVDWIKQLPERYRQLTDATGASVIQIEVRAIE